MFEPGEMSLGAIEFLSNTPEISIIDVTEAADATVGNGHNYFRSSPWVSSDILMTLRYNLRPGDRGLVIGDKAPIWSFPPDYITRLRAAIATANPALIHRLDKQESMSKAK
jgi:hypothetical protein